MEKKKYRHLPNSKKCNLFKTQYICLGGNQAQINRNLDIGDALSNFNEYTSRKLFTVDKDTTQLLTGEVFIGGEAGIAVPATVCTQKSVGISVDINTYEPHLLAGKIMFSVSFQYNLLWFLV